MTSLLIVDDEQGVRSIISRWATTNGYAVTESDSATAGLEQMHRSACDIALCDLNMPGRSGRWLADQIRTQFPETAVVMTTGDAKDVAARLPEGAAPCLMKPFTIAELATTLRRALDWHIKQVAAGRCAT